MFTGVSSGLTAVLAIAVIVAGREISDQPDDRRGRGMMFGEYSNQNSKRYSEPRVGVGHSSERVTGFEGVV